MKNTTVLIIDDHMLFRSGIKLVLQRNESFEVVGEAANGLEGAKLANRLKPDVVLLDLHMPGTGGLESIALIKQESPRSEILMLTVSEDAEDLLEALRQGARGYLLKNIDTEFLTDAIRRAANGESVLTPSMAAKLADVVRSPQETLKLAAHESTPLSPREKEIIGMLALGASNKQIARDLDLAESTVKIHVQGILRKLKLSSRVQAAVFAVENGFVKNSGKESQA